MPQISLIIPVYNSEAYLARCLDSILQQTLREIEVICVDDCSSDGSPAILERYRQLDPRVAVIRYTENKSASQARKDGVMAASGQFVMFVDADDYLALNACEELLAEMLRQNVDILHFGTNVANSANVAEKRIESIRRFTSPLPRRLSGRDVFEACFVRQEYNYTLWNKIYRAELCKRAFAAVKDGFYPKAQDLYAFVLIAFFAGSYLGIPDKCYYNYSFGVGVTGADTISLKQFDRMGYQSKIMREIREFFIGQGVWEEYQAVYTRLFDHLINECVYKWFEFLPQEESARGFDLLVRHWGAGPAVTAVMERYLAQKDVVARKVFAAETLAPQKTAVRRIGLYYHRISIGGVQRVLSLLIPIWQNSGYEVVFFSDEPASEDDYALPPEVRRIVLPSCFKIKQGSFHLRVDEWQRFLREEQIDIVLYNAASSAFLLLDILLVKSLGIPFVLTVHELFSHGMTTGNLSLAQRPSIFQLTDEMTVLSRTEQRYWNILGIRAVYQPNPLTFDIRDMTCSSLDEPNIIWIGRFDHGKQYLDAIRIFAEVVKSVPAARMFMLGKDVVRDATSSIFQLVEDLKLGDNIVFCGQQKDVGPYYRQCSVHLMTSVSESAPMTISESKSFGVPCVLYELPYLEALRDGKGFIAVGQGEIKPAARAIVRLLEDEAYRKEMGRQARASIETFAQYDLAAGWQRVIHSAITPGEVIEDREYDANTAVYEALILRTMLFHYKTGCEFHAGRVAQLNKEIADLKAQLQKVRRQPQRKSSRFRSLAVKAAKKVLPAFAVKFLKYARDNGFLNAIGKSCRHVVKKLKKGQ